MNNLNFPKGSEHARLLRDNGAGTYAFYKEAGDGWHGGFLVITKAGKHKRRTIDHVTSEHEARNRVNDFFDKLPQY